MCNIQRLSGRNILYSLMLPVILHGWDSSLLLLFVVYFTLLLVYRLYMRRGQTSVNIANVLAEIRTEHPYNTSLKGYSYVNPTDVS